MCLPEFSGENCDRCIRSGYKISGNMCIKDDTWVIVALVVAVVVILAVVVAAATFFTRKYRV